MRWRWSIASTDAVPTSGLALVPPLSSPRFSPTTTKDRSDSAYSSDGRLFDGCCSTLALNPNYTALFLCDREPFGSCDTVVCLWRQSRCHRTSSIYSTIITQLDTTTPSKQIDQVAVPGQELTTTLMPHSRPFSEALPSDHRQTYMWTLGLVCILRRSPTLPTRTGRRILSPL